VVEERLVRFRPRAVLVVLGIIVAAVAVLQVLLAARTVLIWILIAVFLALALNPAVEWLQERGLKRRGAAVAVTFTGAIATIVAVGALFVPTLVREVNDFAEAVPDYVEDLTEGRGRLGFLEREYQIVERVREAIEEQGASGVLGLSDVAVSVTRSIVTGVVAVLTITFLTLFMLLEGRAWMERFYGLLPEDQQPRWRAVGQDIYRVVGGYVAGNLLISLIAGVVSTVVLLVLGIQYAFALGLLVALLDLVPLAGATIAAVLVSTVAFIDRGIVIGIVVVAFFLAYQQLENHVLQPMVYGRTVQLSPLAVLIAVLIGAQVAGIVGALGAIPVAGTIQVVLRDWLAHRRGQLVTRPPGVEGGGAGTA
jgi:predicted PurR-regulated permease PerM